MKIAIDEVFADRGAIRLAVIEASGAKADLFRAVLNWLDNNRPDLHVATLSNPHGFNAYHIEG